MVTTTLPSTIVAPPTTPLSRTSSLPTVFLHGFSLHPGFSLLICPTTTSPSLSSPPPSVPFLSTRPLASSGSHPYFSPYSIYIRSSLFLFSPCFTFQLPKPQTSHPTPLSALPLHPTTCIFWFPLLFLFLFNLYSVFSSFPLLSLFYFPHSPSSPG